MLEKIYCKVCGKVLAKIKGLMLYLYCKDCKDQRVINIEDLIDIQKDSIKH